MAVVGSATALASSVGGTVDLKIIDELEAQIEKDYLAKIGKMGVEYLSKKEKRTLRKKKKLSKKELKSKFERSAQTAYDQCVRENSRGKCEKGYRHYKKVIKAIFANKTFAGAKFRECIEKTLADLSMNQEISQKQITQVNKCYFKRTVNRAITSSGIALFVGVGVGIKLKNTAATDWIQEHIYDEFETKYIVNVKQYFNGNTKQLEKVVAQALNGYREQMFFDYWNETTEAGLDLASQIAGLQS